jgi:CdiI N-terminal domain
MSFSVEFEEDDFDPPPEGNLLARITVGAFTERLLVLTTFWDADQYREHWTLALRRLVHDGADSCLLTSVADPSSSRMLYWWPMYRDGKTVHFQEHMLFFDQLRVPFDIRDPYASIPPRRVVDDDGEALFEVSISVDDIHSFLRSCNGTRRLL